jgi:nucleoid DNA-binding protein
MLMSPSPDDLLRALAAAVRDELMQRNPVSLRQLGTLHVHHEPSRVTDPGDGPARLLPPRDVIVHEPPPDSDG